MTNQFELEQKREYTRIKNAKKVLNFNSLEYQRTDIYTCSMLIPNTQTSVAKKNYNDDFLLEIIDYCEENYPDENNVCYLSNIREVGSYDNIGAVYYTLVAEIKIYLGHGVQ